MPKTAPLEPAPADSHLTIDLGWEATPDGTPGPSPKCLPPTEVLPWRMRGPKGVDTLLRLVPGRRRKDETMSRNGIKG
ncbi:hypothetical protein HRbin11_00391 [bacterium HR11]|nr:hypothetical protein HRbin11_00391 [bacterium HR11]